MSRTQTWTRNLLVGSTVVVTMLAVSACCKDNKEEAEPEAEIPTEPTSANEEESAPELGTTDPEWKTKCPEAERPESGTVTALRTLQIYKEPNTDSNKESTIGSGTWVNLLGAKGTWYCIDYPCGVGKLCPGWIESRYSQRKATPVVVDAGTTKDAEPAKQDAEVAKDAEVPKDAEVTTDAAPRIRIPRFKIVDGGVPIRTPPGGRPPAEDVKPQ